MRPTDLYVLLGVIASRGRGGSLRDLATRLHVDHTLVHRALKNAEGAGLYRADERRVNLASFEELATHAARFIAPAPLGALTRGFPAAWAAEPMSALISESGIEPPPVWPSARGPKRGQELRPLHPSAVKAINDERLARLLSIVDSLRAGDARVRNVAGTALSKELRRAS
jgi:hypothetical protein